VRPHTYEITFAAGHDRSRNPAHLHSIYRQFGVTSRADVIERAADLRLP
jgi:hypothetical protein